MRRTLFLSVVLPLLMGFLGTVLAQSLVLPGLADAQEARIRAEQLTLVGDNGADRLRLAPGAGAGAAVGVLDSDGKLRIDLRTGGSPTAAGTTPEAASVNVFASNGSRIARIGTGGAGTAAAPGAELVLRDRKNRDRLRLLVADDGTRSIHLLDADGNVAWSAR
jgi:hypothetical protein